MARETFGVERVIARIYDAGRAEVYERLGIPTVATVPWATGRLIRYITSGSSPVVWRDQTGEVSLVAVVPPSVWVGVGLASLADLVGGTVVALTRFGECRVPGGSTLVQADDLIHLAVPSGVVDDLDDILERGPSDD